MPGPWLTEKDVNNETGLKIFNPVQTLNGAVRCPSYTEINGKTFSNYKITTVPSNGQYGDFFYAIKKESAVTYNDYDLSISISVSYTNALDYTYMSCYLVFSYNGKSGINTFTTDTVVKRGTYEQTITALNDEITLIDVIVNVTSDAEGTQELSASAGDIDWKDN